MKKVHAAPIFLPWHRYFVQVYEDTLRNDCGYTGTAMYWNWEADWASPSKSSVWDSSSDLGFGGNGTESEAASNGGHPRVMDGAFKNLRPTYWDGQVDPHYLSRDWAPAVPEANLPEMIGYAYGPEIMSEVRSWTDFATFAGALESSPHGGVHAGIARGRGDMGPVTSPNGMYSSSLYFSFL